MRSRSLARPLRRLGLSLWLGCCPIVVPPPAVASGDEPCDMLANRTIRWIVPSKPGGGYDAYARLLQPFVEQYLAAQIMIENRPDAGGIVGALAIRDAKADGSTLGIINAPGLLAAAITNGGKAPRPMTDFTILSRLVGNRMVLMTGGNSGFKTIDDVLQASVSRPLLVGVRDVGSLSFIAVPVTAALLDLNYALVSGYVGGTARSLAAIRGEIDLTIQDSGSIRRFVDDGELIPLLQINRRETAPVKTHATDWLGHVPALEDMAVLRADHSRLDPAEARRMAVALSSIIGAGRLVVAPAGLPAPVTTCLVSALSAVLDSAPLRKAAAQAGLGIAPADPQTARQDLRTATQALRQFSDLVRSAIEQTRQ